MNHWPWGAKYAPHGPSLEALAAREAVRAFVAQRTEHTKEATALANRASARASLWRQMRRDNHFAEAIYGTLRRD